MGSQRIILTSKVSDFTESFKQAFYYETANHAIIADVLAGGTIGASAPLGPLGLGEAELHSRSSGSYITFPGRVSRARPLSNLSRSKERKFCLKINNHTTNLECIPIKTPGFAPGVFFVTSAELFVVPAFN